MAPFHHIVVYLEDLIERELSGWPAQWVGFHWPGYTYEHTLRVRNLSVSMARQLGADEGLVELAALLHDIGKPEGEPHGEAGARRAETVLTELGMDVGSRSRIGHMIQTHVAPVVGYPLENLALSDADFIDANFGYVAFTRYITIRASRGHTVPEMIHGAGEWLEGMHARQAKVVTDLGRAISHERLGRMRSFLQALHGDLNMEGEARGPAVGLAHYLAGHADQPSLSRQIGRMEGILQGGPAADGLQPSPFLQEFVYLIKEEVAGGR